MLDSITKKRIDDLRNILVGKIPDPKSQVEQITTGLIYKFMYDIDQESIEMGGVPSFFVGEFEKYSWEQLFDSKLSGVDKVQLYSDAIEGMYTNPTAPALFREIFKNAFLPFKDPSTLNMFLKELNEFDYSHSENLGDAFEYLLSFMGSQGDAGQFRTPRHIIDFIVEIVNPQKNETILDPSCGTAGFLISSFKHILRSNTDKREGDLLSADERKKVGQNLSGYDISPDMVRISLVNMYLNQFANPDIQEYDTLSSEDKWNEYYDVILANPPFFSPTGGIQPHKRFGIESTRAEVLFVDYIMEHLKPSGRAGIIVPEGIVFQNGTAYKTLRKKLVEDCLVGVISLPAGVFQPYSGVKTSILILDKELNQKSENIFFAQIENDGFSLAARRAAINKNDLPLAIEGIASGIANSIVDFVSKEKIADKEHILTSGTYKSIEIQNSKFPLVPLGEICDLVNGRAYKKHELLDEGKYPVLRVGNFFTKSDWYYSDLELTEEKYCDRGDLLFAWSASFGTKIWDGGKTIFHYHIWKLVPDYHRVNKLYLKYLMDYMTESFKETGGRGGIMMHLTKSGMEKQEFPLPPIEVQQEIVDELEGYQKIIDGCRQVVENYKPTINIDPSWETISFDDAPIEIIDGDRGKNYPSGSDFSDEGHCLFLNTKNVRPDGFEFSNKMFITQEKDGQLRKGKLKRYDVLLTTRGTVGNTAYFGDDVQYVHLRINSGMLIFRCVSENIDSEYLFYFFQSKNCSDQFKQLMSGSAQPQLPISSLKNALIPIPSLDVQRTVVKSIKLEKEVIDGNKRLKDIYTQKIQDRISKVWGE
jgi:type I restriction enzyme M protein